MTDKSNFTSNMILGIQDISILLPWDQLSILLARICDTLFNIVFTFSDIGYLEKKVWGYLPVYRGYLPVYFKEYGIFGTPYTSLYDGC